MTTINDLKKQFYLSSGIASGTITDMEMKWLAQQGATLGTLPDRWMAFLAAQGQTTGTFNDRLYKFLGGLGYTGTLNDRLKQYYSAGPVSILDQDAFFPASTAANTGGFKPFDTDGNEVDVLSVDSQVGATRTWDAVGNRLVATNGTPDVDDGVQITITTSLGTITVTIDSATAGECYASFSELSTLFSTDLSGRTLFGRPGDYVIVGGNGFFDGDFNDLSSVVTLDACSVLHKPVWDRLAIFSTGAPTTDIGNVTVRNMVFNRDTTEEDKLTGNINGSTTGLIQIENAGGGVPEDILIEDCVCYSNFPIARITGTRPAETIYGVWIKDGLRINVNNNVFSYLTTALIVEDTDNGSFNENVVHHTWDDMIKVVDDVTNFEIHDNECSEFIGDHGFHPDFIHHYQTNVGHTQDTVSIRGNVGWPGVEGHLAPGWPSKQLSGGGSALTREGSYQTTNRTVGTADKDLFIICDGTLTITLDDPTLAAGEEELGIQLRAVGGSTSNVLTIDRNGYTLLDIDNGAVPITTDFIMAEPWATVLIRMQPADNRWILQRIGPIYQGTFTNPNTGGYLNISHPDNIFWTVGGRNGIRYDGASSDNVTIERTVLLQAWPGDLNGTGNPNSHWNGGPTRQGQFEFQGTNGEVKDSMGFAVAGTFTDTNNAVQADIDPTVWADMVANFNVDDPGTEVHYPTSRLEAIEKARPKAGSFMITNSIGSLGAALDGSEDTYNFGQVDGPYGPIVPPVTDVTFTELQASAFTNNGQRLVETVTTSVAASGNHPVRAMFAFRHVGGATPQAYTATADGNNVTDIKVQQGTNFACVCVDIPSGSVPAGTFDIVLTSTVNNFNGIACRVVEMVGANDDQTGADTDGLFAGTVTPRTLNITTATDGNGATGMACFQTAGTSLTGTPTPTVLDVSVDVGNTVTFSQFGVSEVPTAGAVSMTFAQTSSTNNVQFLVEVLKA